MYRRHMRVLKSHDMRSSKVTSEIAISTFVTDRKFNRFFNLVQGHLTAMQFVQRRPDPRVARKELVHNLTVFAAIVLAVRAAPYVLQALQKQ